MKISKKGILVLVAILLLLLLAVFWLSARTNTALRDKQNMQTTKPQNDTLTWDEYKAMSLEEQDAFFQQFQSVDAFEEWMNSVKPGEGAESIPVWDQSGKKPDTYTWEEYQSLSPEYQEAFFQWFDSVDTFEEWIDSAKPTEDAETIPVWDQSAKTPDAYTWEEYQSLSREYQEAFFQWFSSEEAFEKWMNSVRPAENAESVPVWDQSGKKPDAYTWEEYQSLSPERQEAFFQWFDSEDAFEAWMGSAKPAASEDTVPSWNQPGKAPDSYTWEEYQALSPEYQEAFFQWFGSEDAFEKWMDSVKPAEGAESAPVWHQSGKAPDAYTWEEYEALSPREQDAFFLWFDSIAAFEKWMETAKPKEGTALMTGWDKHGKQPDEYTWVEYEALRPEEKDAFFLWFASIEAFEAWMDAAK